MTDNAKRSFPWGKLLIILGVLLLAAGAVLFLGNRAEEIAAEQSARRLLAAVESEIMAKGEDPLPEHAPKPGKEPAPPLEELYAVDGILTIPKIGITLPVLRDYSEDLLRVSVCIFERETGEDGRMVLAGHDYKSHFGKIKTLVPGDAVDYETLSGGLRHYTVIEVTAIDPDDRAGLEAGEWDMTLLTCNRDLSKRILVRLGRTD